MGLHKAEEIEEFGKNDLKVLSEILADKPFFFGDEPTTVNMKLNFTFICILIIDYFLCLVGLRCFLSIISNSLHL